MEQHHDDHQMELPLDERYRRAEQYALDLAPVPHPREKPEVTCGRLGYCYCPKCNPR